jgi:hypothetical protein
VWRENVMVNKNDFTKVKKDVNGNPRYAIHFLKILNQEENSRFNDNTDFIARKYNYALKKSRQWGGRKFHNKQFGGGIAFQSYALDRLCNEINKTLDNQNDK